jgi:hypothetical protein
MSIKICWLEVLYAMLSNIYYMHSLKPVRARCSARKRRIAFILHDRDSILEITPTGEMICHCPIHGEVPVAEWLARRLKPYMRGRVRLKTSKISVPEDFWWS